MDETQPIPIKPQPGDQGPDFGAPESAEETRPVPVEENKGEKGLRDKGIPGAVVDRPAISFSPPPPPPNWPDKEGWKVGRLKGWKAASSEPVERPSMDYISPTENKTYLSINATPLLEPAITETRPILTGNLAKARTAEEANTATFSRTAAPPTARAEVRAERRTGTATPPPQSRLQRSLSLFVLGATLLMATGTVALAVYIYQPNLSGLSLSLPGGLGKTLGERPGAPAQGTPFGEQLAERVPLGTPGSEEDTILGPTIEPGSAIQVTIETITGNQALDPMLTGDPQSTQPPAQTAPPTSGAPPAEAPTGDPQPTQAAPPASEAPPASQPTDGVQPTAEPTQAPPTQPPATEPPPTDAPTQAPAFDPNQVEAEISFLEKGSFSTGEQTVTVSVYNYGGGSFQVTASDVAFAPPGGGDLAPLDSSPELPIQVNPGQTVEITFVFPTPTSGMGVFKLFTVEFELGDF